MGLIGRDPKGVIAAHKMDRDLKELYVEGHTDRIFLNWLTNDNKNSNTRILEIGLIDIPGTSIGGEKGRLLTLAGIVESSCPRVRVFADADTDRVFDRPVPENVWLTDNRDIESYVLTTECLEKVLKLGLRDEKLNADDILSRAIMAGRDMGFLRLTSELDEYNLPFQRSQIKRHTKFKDGRLTINFEGYVQTLVQNAGMSGTLISGIVERHKEVKDKYSNLPNEEIVHGKDTVAILEHMLRERGLGQHDIGMLLRCSYERRLLENHPNLQQVYEFLTS